MIIKNFTGRNLNIEHFNESDQLMIHSADLTLSSVFVVLRE